MAKQETLEFKVNRQEILIKSNIKKNTEWTVFLDTVTITAETTAIIEKV